MIFGDEQILSRMKVGELVLGASAEQINPASINLCLGRTFLIPKFSGKCIRLGDEVDYERIELKENAEFVLRSGQFALATTEEEVNLPNDVAAFVQGRSSIGRIGLTTQNAGFVDPGFHGHITLELVNENPNPIILRPGYPVVQLVFFKTYVVNKPYCGKYNGQVEATGSRMHMDNQCVGKTDDEKRELWNKAMSGDMLAAREYLINESSR